MAPINGRPFLEYQMDYWIGQGVSRFILSVGYKRESIMSHFGARYRTAQIDYAIEETPARHGRRVAAGGRNLYIKTSPFLVLNGDTFFDVPLKQLEQAHITNRSNWTIALFKADAPDRYGKITIAADGAITSIPPEKAAPGDYANGGVYLLSPAALAGLHHKQTRLARTGNPPRFSLSGRPLFYGLPHDGQFFLTLACRMTTIMQQTF